MLKHTFSSAPLLCHYNFSETAVLETNASDYAIGALLPVQQRPCTFYSHKMNPAEINYNIHDKELLTIVGSLNAWSHYVVSILADEPLTIC
jgi:hypothetical protein